MALAEARALAGDLRVLPWDEEHIARSALTVTTTLLAASPRVAWAGAVSVRLCACASVRMVGGGRLGSGGWTPAGLGSESKLVVKLRRLTDG